MKKVKFDDIVSYTYIIGAFNYIKGEEPYPINGIKGKENYPHSTVEDGVKTEYYGNGQGRVIPLSQLNLTVNYHKGAFESEHTDFKGSFYVNMINFIKRNVMRNDGEKINRISSNLVDELNKAVGFTSTSVLFKPDTLPLETYLLLLDSISKCTNLKIESSNYAVIGEGVCVKVDDSLGNDGEGVISFNNEKYFLPMKRLNKARVGDNGEVIYYDDRKNYTGLIFQPF